MEKRGWGWGRINKRREEKLGWGQQDVTGKATGLAYPNKNDKTIE